MWTFQLRGPFLGLTGASGRETPWKGPLSIRWIGLTIPSPPMITRILSLWLPYPRSNTWAPRPMPQYVLISLSLFKFFFIQLHLTLNIFSIFLFTPTPFFKRPYIRPSPENCHLIISRRTGPPLLRKSWRRKRRSWQTPMLSWWNWGAMRRTS